MTASWSAHVVGPHGRCSVGSRKQKPKAPRSAKLTSLTHPRYEALEKSSPRELLYASAFAYRREGDATIAEILGALADADDAVTKALKEDRPDDAKAILATLEKPLQWARRRGQRSSMAAPTRATAVRFLIDLCDRHKTKDPVDRAAIDEAAEDIALLAATKLADDYAVLGVRVRPLMSPRAIYKRRMAVLASVRAMRMSSCTDPERLAVAVLRGLGLSDATARNAVKAATKSL